MKISSFIAGMTQDQRILSVAVIAVFLPFYFSIAAMAGLLIYILTNEKRRKSSMTGLANYVLYGFTAVTMFIAFIYDNWFGLLAALAFLSLIVILNFAASVMTKGFYIRILHLIAYMSVILSFAAYTEKLIRAPLDPRYRCGAYCGNSNYLAALLTVSILACAYLELSKRGRPLFCYTVALIDGIAIFFSGSMFAWVELLAGLALMLLLMKKHISLSFLFLFSSTFLVILISSPGLLPRAVEATPTALNRFAIWKTAFKGFFEYPLLGRGFYSYKIICKEIAGAYPAWHSHNLFLESLISFGLIGSVGLGFYFLLVFRRFGRFLAKGTEHNGVACFTVALIGGALVHSMVDLTFLWVQTGLLAALLLGGGLGASIQSTKKTNE